MQIFFTIFWRKITRKISDDNDSTGSNPTIFDLPDGPDVMEKRIFRRLRNQSNNCFACTLRSGKPTLNCRKRLLNKALRKSSHHAHDYNDYQYNRRTRQTLLTGTIAMVTLFTALQIKYNDNIVVMATTPSTQGT